MKSKPSFFKSPKTGLKLGIVWYLLIVIGFVAPAHRHQIETHYHADVDCQLCQVSSEVFLTLSFRLELIDISFFQNILPSPVAPILFVRHKPFSSRGPPFV